MLQKALPMPGAGDGAGSAVHVEPSVGLQEASAPLPYLRSRNALKIILDLDQDFGKPRVPEQRHWMRNLAVVGGKSGS